MPQLTQNPRRGNGARGEGLYKGLHLQGTKSPVRIPAKTPRTVTRSSSESHDVDQGDRLVDPDMPVGTSSRGML
ncbi:hypothetical protein EYF80_029709 [Liparis tanakae]|uniref:Uncharacterized protein n=1 Tax=Liparis tanakae TaxID=230148 RepID=A0A4Z2H3I5_9TELE|nr:hypothetical protein EYF80_029709 [Liparis tanakae]